MIVVPRDKNKTKKNVSSSQPHKHTHTQRHKTNQPIQASNAKRVSFCCVTSKELLFFLNPQFLKLIQTNQPFVNKTHTHVTHTNNSEQNPSRPLLLDGQLPPKSREKAEQIVFVFFI